MSKEGIRIQKVLSDNGVLSRRKSEDAILHRRVQVNGRPAVIGQRVNPAKDVIALDGVNLPLKRRSDKVYLMLNKPRGYVTTTSDELGRKCVVDLVSDAPARVYPVGRLDKLSEGLLLLTNDGEFANQIMHPSGHINKVYRVTVASLVTEDMLTRLSTGVQVDGRTTLPASVHLLSSESGRSVMQLSIFEGRNRQVRKMCEAVGLNVKRLKRISIGPLKLGMLPPGEWRELKKSELIAMRNAIKKAENKPTRAPSPPDRPAAPRRHSKGKK